MLKKEININKKILFWLSFLLTAWCFCQNPKIEKQLRLSDSLFNIGKLDESSRILSDLSNSGYKHPALFTKKAIIAFMKGDTISGMKNLNMATSLDPTYPKAYEIRSIVFQRKGNYVQAMYDIEALIKLRPEEKRFVMVRAGLKHNLGKYREALEDYDLCIKMDPFWDSSYVMKARAVFYEMDTINKPFEILQECIKKNPRSVYAYETRINLMITGNRYDEIIKDLDQLLQIAPQNAGSYYFAKAKARVRMRDTTGACEDMEKARLNKNPDALMWMNANCKKVIQTKDFVTESLVLEAEAFMRKAMYVSAIERLDSALKMRQDVHRYYVMRGMSKYFLKNYKLAEEDLQASLKLMPGDQMSYYYLTLCEIALENQEQAKVYALEAVKGGEDYKSFQILATLCIDTKDYACAEKNLKAAIRLRPEDSQLYMIAGEMYSQQNNQVKACEAYRKAKALGDGRAIVKVVMNCN